MTTKKDKTIRQKVEEFLNEENHFTNGLAFVEKKTGVNRLYLFGGRRFIFGILIIFIILLLLRTRDPLL